MNSILRYNILNFLYIYQNIFHKPWSILKKPRVQIIYLHHIEPNQLDKLRCLIQYLRNYYTFISYSQAVTLIKNNAIDKPFVVFSFDDGFLNNLEAGRLLNNEGISACFFVNPYIIGEENSSTVKRYCYEKLHMGPTKFMDWKNLEKLVEMNHEVGSHSLSHENLSELSKNQAQEDISNSKRIIEQYLGEAIHFSYPYGRFKHFSRELLNVVYEAGFNSCASAERGCHINNLDRKDNKILLRRDHIVINWPINHIKYFLMNSAVKANINNDYYWQS